MNAMFKARRLVALLLGFPVFVSVPPVLADAEAPRDANVPSHHAPASGKSKDGCDQAMEKLLGERDAANIASSVGLWEEAIKTFEALAIRLPEIEALCPPDGGTRIASLHVEIADSHALAEAGMHRGLCVPAMDRALALDARAAALQIEGKDWTEVEQLFGRAEAAWQEAVSVCRGESRELAAGNRADSARARAKAAALLGEAGPCEKAMTDAARLGELARSTWTEKHWDEAAMWHRKAGTAWGVAAEKCREPKRSQALKRKEGSSVDAHNAIHCVAAWDAANALSVRLKSLARDVSVEARSDLRNQTESAWNDAAAGCRGSSGDKAKANAELLAKERGSAPPPSTRGETPIRSHAQANASDLPRTPRGAGESAASSAPTRSPLPLPEPSAGNGTLPHHAMPIVELSGRPAPAPAATPLPTLPDAPVRVQVATTVYVGKFALDASSGKVSGNGRVEWDNGDIFEGTLVGGKSEGTGTMTWKKSGNRYIGQWQDDVQHGNGVMIFSGGSRYEGEYVNGRMTGLGKYFYGESGDRYEGHLLDGKPNGNGTYLWKSGERYEGGWQMGVRHGKGRFTWADGSYWEGLFDNGNQTDNGTMVFVKRL